MGTFVEHPTTVTSTPLPPGYSSTLLSSITTDCLGDDLPSDPDLLDATNSRYKNLARSQTCIMSSSRAVQPSISLPHFSTRVDCSGSHGTFDPVRCQSVTQYGGSSNSLPAPASIWLPSSVSRLSPRAPLVPDMAGQMIDYIMSQHERLINLAYVKPTYSHTVHVRNFLIQRMRTSHATRLATFLGCKILETALDGTSAEKFPVYLTWLHRFDQQLRGRPEERTISIGSQDRLSGRLEVNFLKLRLLGSANLCKLLRESAPVFLEIALTEGAWRSTPGFPSLVSVVDILTSPRHELAHFFILDSLCSMLYALPQVVGYDTSVTKLDDDVHLGRVHGCPATLQIILAEINSLVHQNQAGNKFGWQSIEQRLKSWQPVIHISEDGESWRTIACLAIEESWRYTLLIYLYMAACGATTDDLRVQSAVQQVFQLTSIVRRFEGSLVTKHVFAQYLVAGACARSEKQRAIARQRLEDKVDNGLWVIQGLDFLPVLDHLWHGAAVNGQPIRWSDYAHSRRTALSVAI
ncbi:hypothetical protein FRC12_002806 [Ceratobasidium sp. 428]|nr:hypothetical protein FRC12_002806 [Ceratobasidium sp. 428]